MKYDNGQSNTEVSWPCLRLVKIRASLDNDDIIKFVDIHAHKHFPLYSHYTYDVTND